MITPHIEELNKGTLVEKVFRKKWPEFYNFLMDNYKDCNSLSEKLYLYYNRLDKRPVCEICGADVGFDGFVKGFRKCCSVQCGSKTSRRKEKIKQTNLEKYGCEYGLQNKEVKEKIKQTNLERYGIENISQNEMVREKVKQTNLERYGVENPFSSGVIKEKIKQTNLERYGCECGSQNEKVKEKIKQTNLERYGVEYSLQGPTIRNKIKQTNLERYGTEYASQNESIKEKIKQTNIERYGVEYNLQNGNIRNKIKQTNLERYGVECSLQNKYIKEKIKQTNLERYGVENPIKNLCIKEKAIKSRQQTTINSHPDLLRYTEESGWVCKCPHPECSKCSEKEYITYSVLYYNREQKGIEQCTKLFPIHSLYSTPELQIRNFLNSLNIEYITNDRSIISPKELDIYIPSKNIAIEFNGSYWHSNKDKYYHRNKTIACYSKGILLVHIYEYEWNKDRESILSKLKDILDGKEVDGIVPIKDYDKYILSEPVLIDCGSYKIWNEGEWQLN